MMGAGRISAAAALAFTLAASAGCGDYDAEKTDLATRCMRAGDDNRAKLAASWLADAEIEIEGDLVTVRTSVPVGVSVSGKVKFRHGEYRCRRHGERLEFLGYRRK